jgi:CheY-like chemotaxis protein
VPTEVVVELIKAIPTLLWVLFIGILVAIFYKPIRHQLIPRMSGLKAFGVEATFLREQLTEAARKEPDVTKEALNQVVRRAQRLGSIIRDAQLLVVNDVPEEMMYVRKILRSLGIFVDIARDTDQALSMMKETRYDVVLSDMSRDGVADEGIRFLNESIRRELHRPTIFTVGLFDPARGVPGYAFGITNRIDELLNLVFDVLERERG